jgi:hypothetical protein
MEAAWSAGQVVSTTIPAAVSGEALPVRAVLTAGLLAPNGEWQEAASANGRILDLPVSLATVKIAPVVPVTARPQYGLSADFGQQLRWLGYDLTPGDQAISMTFYWQATAHMSQDYTVFVHLLDEDGRLITQYDGQPQGGWYPTTIWDVGEVVTDSVTLNLPADPPSGGYQMVVGVYLLETLERLPVIVNGEPQPDGRIIIRDLDP